MTVATDSAAALPPCDRPPFRGLRPRAQNAIRPLPRSPSPKNHRIPVKTASLCLSTMRLGGVDPPEARCGHHIRRGPLVRPAREAGLRASRSPVLSERRQRTGFGMTGVAGWGSPVRHGPARHSPKRGMRGDWAMRKVRSALVLLCVVAVLLLTLVPTAGAAKKTAASGSWYWNGPEPTLVKSVGDNALYTGSLYGSGRARSRARTTRPTRSCSSRCRQSSPG